jgi:hypothetical protein
MLSRPALQRRGDEVASGPRTAKQGPGQWARTDGPALILMDNEPARHDGWEADSGS